MSIQLLLTSSKVLYEEKHMLENNQIFKFLFRSRDISKETTFKMDEFTQVNYAIAYRDKNNQAHLRPYEAGLGAEYEPPIASEMTPIDEKLRDESVEGVEDGATFDTAQKRKLGKVVDNHHGGHNMTKNKQSIDVYRTGIFYAKGIKAEDIGKGENYARDIANDLTADFSLVTVDQALTAVNAQLDAKGCPKGQRAVIVGQSWLSEIQTDSNVLARMQANSANVLVRQTMNPPRSFDGLFWVGEYLPAGSVSPLQIYSYSPDEPYRAYKDATPEEFMPTDELVGFSTQSKSYEIYRGIDVVNGTMIKRESGEIVFDSWIEPNPTAEMYRSSTRHMFLMGNINHTVRSTGSNFN